MNEYFICANCGAPMHEKFFPPALGEFSAFKISRIRSNLPLVPHRRVPWDNTVDAYVKTVEKIDAMLSLPDMQPVDKGLVEKMSSFLELWHNPEFQIAFVGTIKTGKSTLINALLGRNYASMEVTPETAALTRFRSSLQDYIKVSFYSREEWQKLWASRSSASSRFEDEYNLLNADAVRGKWVGHKPIHKLLPNDKIEKELKRWLSSQFPEHFFVKEIEVGISTLRGVPPQVVFVETPGLYDTVAYRSEITRDYIRKANAVFVCIDAQKIQQPEIDTISSVFSFSSNKKNKVYIIATHWDKLNDPENDWNRQKPFFARQLTGPGFYDTLKDAQENIIPAAAYLYNICRDFPDVSREAKRALLKFLLDYEMDLSNPGEAVAFIKEKANIASIQRVIQDRLVENYQSMLNEDVKYRFKDILHNVDRIMEERQSQLKELLVQSEGSIADLKKGLENKKKAREKIHFESRQLQALMDNTGQKTDELVIKICANLRKQLKKIDAEMKKKSGK